MKARRAARALWAAAVLASVALVVAWIAGAGEPRRVFDVALVGQDLGTTAFAFGFMAAVLAIFVRNGALFFFDLRGEEHERTKVLVLINGVWLVMATVGAMLISR